MARNIKSTWIKRPFLSIFFYMSRGCRHGPIGPLDRLLTRKDHDRKNNGLSLFHYPRCNDVGFLVPAFYSEKQDWL